MIHLKKSLLILSVVIIAVTLIYTAKTFIVKQVTVVSSPTSPLPTPMMGIETPIPSTVSTPIPSPSTLPSPQLSTYAPKVLLIIYNPAVKIAGNQKMVEYQHWNNPDALTQSLILDIQRASHGIVKYKIVERIELDTYPTKSDGFAYTEAEYLACVRSRGSNCRTPDGANYPQMLAQANACEKRNKGEIDEVWLFGGPWFGYYESNLAGPRAFWYNSPPTTGTSCTKLLPIMGFNYERGEAEMFHDFGHRLESVMAQVYGQSGSGASNPWNTFSAKGSVSKAGGCGVTHFPVNTAQEYNYSDKTMVSSLCNDFRNYPQITSKEEKINCDAWGCSQLGFFQWMFGNLPSSPGTTNGKKNNWWGYMVDADNTILN